MKNFIFQIIQMYNLISSVYFYQNQLAIGKNQGKELLVHLKSDLKVFKELTVNNIIIMGNKTYNSLPKNLNQQRVLLPYLKNRVNIVLTKNPTLLKLTDKNDFDNIDNIKEGVFFLRLKDLSKLKTKKNKYVIGGGEIFNLFLREYSHEIDRIYFTQLKGYKVIKGDEPDIFISLKHFSNNYKIIGVSELYKQDDISYRILIYKNFNKCMTEEYKYLDLAKKILRHGNLRTDRTGVGTVSMFGHQMRFDISDSIPMLTTKSVPFKVIVEELLWFLRGDTDAKILHDKGITIWDGNTSKEFLENRGLDYREGILGPGYGWQIRNFGASYNEEFGTFKNCKEKTGFDQLEYLENLLRTDPYSRRIMMCYWNPPAFKDTSLLPCHFSFQLYVEEIKGEKYLSGHFTMRSSDNLAWSFNVVSYSILVYILAKRCNMKPKEIVYTAGDVHIYTSHLDAINTQLSRNQRPFPKLILNDSIKDKNWDEMSFKDFELWGYFPNPSIKMDMAV